MALVVLTLPRRAQIYATILLTPVDMCLRGSMWGVKMCRWDMYGVSYRSLIVKNNWGVSSVIMFSRMAVPNASRHTCHSPEWMKQNLPVPMRDYSVTPIHVGRLGFISIRCVGISFR